MPGAALQVGDPPLQARDLGPQAVAVALELTEEVGERRRDEAQHGAAGPGDDPPGGPGPRRRGGLGQPQGCEGWFPAGAPQLDQEAVGVGFRARAGDGVVGWGRGGQ
ncbi:hypothetical protein [Miltoncostaea oceani]|uniref:hypothetical protein n=1 Tax=Miltoncostaea oceani TaxID=2843216 RepID=UPI001C3E0880|nr:hypothetical protein [Miltoncostaea oceani]